MAKQTVQSLEEYADLLRRSGLVERAELERIFAEQNVASSSGDKALAELIRRLLDEKLITSWQHAHLMEGRIKGFFLGKYKLLNMIGAGGMSTVYLAEHVMMRRRVAVKVLTEGQVDRTTLERFRRECRAVASLDHRNIVRAHDFDSDGKFHYLVMEYVKGATLEALIDREGPLHFKLAADYMRQASEGLAHAHAHGMIHRDIKPSNLLLSQQGTVKILDLGVAKIGHLEHTRLTVDSNQNLLGTVDFLAPEQALSCHEVDPRADLYSMGCTLFYLLTGNPPFANGSQAQKLLSHQIHPIPDLRKKRPGIPETLALICEKLLSKRPEDRHATAADLNEALSDFIEDYAEESIPAPQVAPASDAPIKKDPTGHSETRPNNKRRTVAVSQAMTKVACGGCGATFGAPAQVANRKIQCPHCSLVIFVPGTQSLSAAGASNILRSPMPGMLPPIPASTGPASGSGVVPRPPQ